MVHEFTNSSGQVFAITWHGPGKPDLRLSARPRTSPRCRAVVTAAGPRHAIRFAAPGCRSTAARPADPDRGPYGLVPWRRPDPIARPGRLCRPATLARATMTMRLIAVSPARDDRVGGLRRRRFRRLRADDASCHGTGPNAGTCRRGQRREGHTRRRPGSACIGQRGLYRVQRTVRDNHDLRARLNDQLPDDRPYHPRHRVRRLADHPAGDQCEPARRPAGRDRRRKQSRRRVLSVRQ